MSAYDAARDAVGEALAPIAAYCDRAHQGGDATDPQQAGRFRHVTHLEALTSAVVRYGAAAEAERLLPSARVADLTERIRSGPAFQNAAARPEAHHVLAGAISSHCLPLPSHAADLPLR